MLLQGCLTLLYCNTMNSLLHLDHVTKHVHN